MENRQRESMRKAGKKMTKRKYLIACYEESAMKGYEGDVDEPKRKRKRDKAREATSSTKEETENSSNGPKEKGFRKSVD